MKIQEEIGSVLKKAAEDMKRNFDKHRTELKEYKVGDKVWLEGVNVKMDRPMKKLDDKQFGPFKILKKVGESSYKLDIPKSWKNIHPVFHEELLTAYHEPEFPGQPKNTRPPPEEVRGQEPEYKVNEIVDLRKDREGKIWYKVDWKGYRPHERTWELQSNITNAKKAVQDFHKKFLTKPRPSQQ